MKSDNPPCPCRRCLTERGYVKTLALGYTLTTVSLEGFVGMILCPTCGNKRCPHATDHTYTCTNSNELGQPGSIYQ